MLPENLKSARRMKKGNRFEDFQIGRIFEHHWGRTVRASESILFSTLTLNFNPTYFNKCYAEALGHQECPVNPCFVFTLVQGLSVEDLSEPGGAFLGIDDLEYGASVYPEDTITARSTVKALRASNSNPGTGIVTWHTEGFNQRGERVISFMRTNQVLRAEVAA
ncbi:MaoC family dehydratase [Paracoccus aestuariivivens]|uniref:MaoC family dehydratase n=1 Tax=Paracoccus aestuariivivens TaxID=1820333 RepID=A0A6L6JHI6_9RHOB|nr:MaoC family dehydratase [Paracoccus aestuariivivens]MTH80007.1 MaoC family dehydratase [Paracoccus aestuariivivens]